MRIYIFIFIILAGLSLSRAETASSLSPIALAVVKGGQSLFVAGYTANEILKVDGSNYKVESLALPLPPSGLAVSVDSSRLYVTCAGVQSAVAVVDVAAWRVIGTLPAGHTATAPVLSADGRTLYVCNQFNNDISVFDLTVTNGLAPGREVCRIPVSREPAAADLTKDGKYLLVANFLPAGRADAEHVAAVVSVIDILYVVKTGCQWRQRPREFGPWMTIYSHFRRMRARGTWERVLHTLRGQARVQAGHHADPSVAIMDSPSVKTVAKGGHAVLMRARRSRAASVISP